MFDNKPFIIAGPCSAESEEQVMQVAKVLKENGVKIFRAGIWKPRTRPGCFEGVGKVGLPWLARVKRELGMCITTEVATAEHVELALAAGVDILWIGARTTANPFAVQEVAEALAADAGVSIEEANGLIDKVLELLSEVPETCDLVRRLKEAGCRCYILSNMPREYWAEIEKFPVAKYFDGAVISSHEHLLKPERAIYERLLERYDLNPAETLFTDDKKTNLLAAEELGINTIHFASPDTTPEEIYRLATE